MTNKFCFLYNIINTIKEYEASKEKAVTGGKDFEAAEAEENLNHLHHC